MTKAKTFTEKKIYEAAEILLDNGIYLSVPGWYDIATPEEAVDFIRDNEQFYQKKRGGGK